MGVITVNDTTFQTEMTKAGSKIVAVDFFATWCGPCLRISPVFESLSNRFTDIVFLKVDVDASPLTAASEGVQAMPTFIFYRNREKLARLQGADPQALESKLKELSGGKDESGESAQKGHVDLVSFIEKSNSECLNDSDSHPFINSFTSGPAYLESDCDEQLIMSYGFNQAVKLHSLKISAPRDNGPKTLKLFINLPHTMDFDQADRIEPVQQIELKPSDLTGENNILLRYVKFQNVQNIQIFVKDNQSNSETTRIDHLAFIGSPISMTRMADFKRVTGKKGESH